MRAIRSGRFIGRQTELGQLQRAITAARDGAGQVVLVAGEAGVGKSRLVGDALVGARGQGATVLLGGCVNLRDNTAPLAAVTEALRGLEREIGTAALADLAGPARDALSGLLPGLGRATGMASPAGLMYATAQDRLYAQLIDFLLRLAGTKPVILVVEDLHWADRATLDLLRLLARNISGRPLVVVATYRSDEEDRDRRLGAFIADLDRSIPVERIVLKPFSRAEVTEQVHAILGEQLDPDRLEQIYQRSQGNPFYAEELLSAGSSTNALPDTLRELLEARIGLLPDPARSIAGAVAVHGRPSTEEVLRRATGLSPSVFSRSLHQLLDRKLLERHRADRDTLAFRHALLQEAAYAELLATERLAMHAAFAAALEDQFGAGDADPMSLADLARHWEAAGEHERALAAAMRSGSAAEASHAPALAAEQFERALRLADVVARSDATPAIDQVGLLERAARAAAALGSPRAIRHIERALELVSETSDPVRAGLLRERLGRYRWYAADGAGALEEYWRAVELVPAEPPSAARARVTAGLAQVLMIHARFEESMALCTEAVATARAVGDRAIESHATNTLAANTVYLGDPETGLELLWASKAMAEEIGSVDDIGRAYANVIDALRVIGRFTEAADLGRGSFAWQRAHGLTSVYGVAGLQYAAWALHCLARWDEARAALDEARLHPGDMNDQIMGLAMQALIEASQGNLSLAEAHLDMARPQLDSVIDTQLLLPYAEAAAETHLWRGEPPMALGAIGDAMARAQPPMGANISRFGPVYAYGIRAAADILAGAPRSPWAELAHRLGTECLDGMRRAYAQIGERWPAYVGLAHPYATLCDAEQTRLEGRSDPEAWAAAADSSTRLGLRYVAAYARWREGEAILNGGGRPADARPPLGDSRLEAVAMGAEPLRRAIEGLATRAGMRFGSEPLSSTGGMERLGLTRREMEVLRLLAGGHSNREIGQELFITDKTASVHVSNILAKLGVARRGEAVAVASRLGLATPGKQDQPGGE